MTKSPSKTAVVDPASNDTTITTRLDNTGVAQPMPQGVNVGRWLPPTSDEEFIFKDLDSAPAWIDRNWASYDRGPALALPAGDLYGKPPYTTKVARVGDKVVFTAANGAQPAKFDVIPADHSLDPGVGTIKYAQASNASLEDMLKTGVMSPEQLGTDARAQVAQRSPELQPMLEGNAPAPAPQPAPVSADLDKHETA